MKIWFIRNWLIRLYSSICLLAWMSMKWRLRISLLSHACNPSCVILKADTHVCSCHIHTHTLTCIKVQSPVSCRFSVTGSLHCSEHNTERWGGGALTALQLGILPIFYLISTLSILCNQRIGKLIPRIWWCFTKFFYFFLSSSLLDMMNAFLTMKVRSQNLFSLIDWRTE